jgi:serine/threonine protein kinase
MENPISPSDSYAFHALIGEGGMAKVFLAEHIELRKKVAIKILKTEYRNDAMVKQKFMEEARKMANMRHNNIIEVSDLFDRGDMTAFVMEYVEGKSLGHLLRNDGRLDDETILDYMRQLLSALTVVHKMGYIHRDIKPDNILIDPSGLLKLADFGIAKNTDPNAPDRTGTGLNVMWGTPRYMPPEQITESHSVSNRSDIYSAGVTLWEMVTGRKAFDYPSLQIPIKVVQEKLSATNTPWDSIISRATDKDPDKRYQFAKAMKTDIENCIINNNDNDIGKYISEKSNVSVEQVKNNWSVLDNIIVAIFIFFILAAGFECKKQKNSTIGDNQSINDYNKFESNDQGYVLNKLYSHAMATGYQLNYLEFINLLRNNNGVYNEMYNYWTSQGNSITTSDFNILIGKTDASITNQSP